MVLRAKAKALLGNYFFFFYVCSFLRERVGEGQTERDTESEAGSEL